jgi:hypothetical protein
MPLRWYNPRQLSGMNGDSSHDPCSPDNSRIGFLSVPKTLFARDPTGRAALLDWGVAGHGQPAASPREKAEREGDQSADVGERKEAGLDRGRRARVPRAPQKQGEAKAGGRRSSAVKLCGRNCCDSTVTLLTVIVNDC